MGDAEIIPIGTRGRPGRGSGQRRPSSAARGLAGGRPAPRGDDPAGTDASDATDAVDAVDDAAPDPASAPDPAPDVVGHETPATPPEAEDDPSPRDAPAPVLSTLPPAGGGAGSTAYAGRAPATTVPRHGIPAGDWLAAVQHAAREVFGPQWEPQLARMLAVARHRLTGDYTVDEYGFDAEVTEHFLHAVLRPIAQKWFRIEVRGVENIPAEGGALVVSNHSGTIPVDGLMTMVSTHDATGRFLRPLGADLVFRLPVVSTLARRSGATLACAEDAERMLRGGELVGVWPEGFKGIGKPYSERYKLQRFGRGGFVSAAIRTGVPIIPLSVVGAEEIYPLVGNVPSLARLLGMPYVPITPLFPWLGPLGLVPLPSKWIIEFGEPIRTDAYDEGAGEDPMLVFNVTDQVRETIQQTLYRLLVERGSVFG
ncbi:1-acyl-sn-glycerol-3-phosphate acyltransferase [Nocardioides perillae]|uniref:1-acyl-sn-glycerol-3-phosphate acyltransferase n=1 Tax=Nocardioides perillae TaxID=1119534 RepID=A0A7Y9UUU6_9ACTN|nr:1-acyl-sn-glycerol-3-phosphate acyltransferase [Nocardioides perillae]